MPGGIRDSRRNAGTLLAICDGPASILAAMTSARTETSERRSLEMSKSLIRLGGQMWLGTPNDPLARTDFLRWTP
jgi:putative intracellular protease/amidase